MKWTNRIENIAIMVCSIMLTAFFMNLFVVKPLRLINKENMEWFQKRDEKRDALFLKLAELERVKIENTFTIKKPKKGSTLDINIDNKMEPVFQKQSDDLKTIIDEFSKPDPGTPVKKTFWQRLFKK